MGGKEGNIKNKPINNAKARVYMCSKWHHLNLWGSSGLLFLNTGKLSCSEKSIQIKIVFRKYGEKKMNILKSWLKQSLGPTCQVAEADSSSVTLAFLTKFVMSRRLNISDEFMHLVKGAGESVHCSHNASEPVLSIHMGRLVTTWEGGSRRTQHLWLPHLCAHTYTIQS